MKKLPGYSAALVLLSLSALPVRAAEPESPIQMVGALAAISSEKTEQKGEGENEVLGTYTGALGTNKITVCLSTVLDGKVTGYTVCAGNSRPFTGAISEKRGVYEISAREPGDHPEDGRFTFRFTPGTDRLTGVWIPNDTKKLEKKSFDLPRRAFRYVANSGDFPQTSIRALKTKDVENITPEELRLMRNEIYARHGYSFRMRGMRGHFDAQDWYMPISTDVTDKLTAIEKQNDALLKRYENYGGKYYDSFGR